MLQLTQTHPRTEIKKINIIFSKYFLSTNEKDLLWPLGSTDLIPIEYLLIIVKFYLQYVRALVLLENIHGYCRSSS